MANLRLFNSALVSTDKACRAGRTYLLYRKKKRLHISNAEPQILFRICPPTERPPVHGRHVRLNECGAMAGIAPVAPRLLPRRFSAAVATPRDRRLSSSPQTRASAIFFVPWQLQYHGAQETTPSSSLFLSLSLSLSLSPAPGTYPLLPVASASVDGVGRRSTPSRCRSRLACKTVTLGHAETRTHSTALDVNNAPCVSGPCPVACYSVA